MNYDLIKDKFSTWAPLFKGFIETEEFDIIIRTLKGLSKRGRTVCPFKEQTFRCFSETAYSNLKAVFFIDGPYSSVVNGKSMADGLSLSVSNTQTIPRGLHRLYRAIEQEYSSGFNVDMIDEPDLGFLARQGILLLNSALTAEQNKPGSHYDLWRPFMKYFFIEIINYYPSSLPIVFMGENAKSYTQLVAPFNNISFELDDPELFPETESWQSNRFLNKVDIIIKDNHPEFEGIKWFNEICTA
ncbi:Uracil-DNA glycosylase [Chitinophaga sp. YR573]|uniref:hypothetical protein n=1 Tax=Chitinophaga sp. YR573 TaxID=1881040 RepID=UPI0008B65919|nr:hypothetical protein [Chitinophaga sp. YR573]SEW21819.1 Uracil-DNA glycosylase [Chitinophaga sp. YR573]